MALPVVFSSFQDRCVGPPVTKAQVSFFKFLFHCSVSQTHDHVMKRCFSWRREAGTLLYPSSRPPSIIKVRELVICQPSPLGVWHIPCVTDDTERETSRVSTWWAHEDRASGVVRGQLPGTWGPARPSAGMFAPAHLRQERLRLGPDVFLSKKTPNPDVFHIPRTNKQKSGCVTSRRQVNVNGIVQKWFHRISHGRKDESKCLWT